MKTLNNVLSNFIDGKCYLAWVKDNQENYLKKKNMKDKNILKIKQIEVFSTLNDLKTLQEMVNAFLLEFDESLIVDVRFNTPFIDSSGHCFFSAIVIYKEEV